MDGIFLEIFEYLQDFRSMGRLSCSFAVLGVILFVLFTFLAMLSYPGGYDFISYHFSDLGSVFAKNGDLNTLSSFFFRFALFFITLSLIPFWLVIPSLFIESRLGMSLSICGSISGLLASPFIFGVALFPLDTHFSLHMVFTLIFVSFFSTAIFLYSVAILFTRKYPFYLSFLGFLLMILLFAIFPLSLSGSFLGALLQKVAMYGCFVWVLIPVFLVWNLTGSISRKVLHPEVTM